MDFITYSTDWAKSEVLQGKIIFAIGVMLLIALFATLRSEHELLRGSTIPLGLLIFILVGYGGYILYSRPAHSASSIASYEQSRKEAIVAETAKHINDNKAGKTLLRYVYPSFIIISALALFFLSGAYHKGLALGFILVFTSTYIIDYGFVSRSDAFIDFLKSLSS